MIKILCRDFVPDSLIKQLREWCESEWGEVDPFEGNHPEIVVPSPVVAVDENTLLLGGLAFSSFTNPNNKDIAVWINVLLISPSQRKKGIASQLVQSAEVEAKLLSVYELFVLTEFPDLYKKLGWLVIGLDSTTRNETILTKTLAST